jgi:hypothetical protein
VSSRHRQRLLPDGRNMCSARRCEFTGTSAEVTAHVRFGLRRSPDGMWVGPGATTASSLPEMLVLLNA